MFKSTEFLMQTIPNKQNIGNLQHSRCCLTFIIAGFLDGFKSHNSIST